MTLVNPINSKAQQDQTPNQDGFNVSVFKQDRVEVLSNNKGWLRVRNLAATTGAAVLPVSTGGEVLLVQELRFVDDQWKRVWNIPRGAGDQHESSLDTAIRELQEETGVRVTSENMASLGKIHPDNGFLLSSIDIYAATVGRSNPSLRDWSQGGGECTNLKWWSSREIELAVISGELTDSITLSALTAWRGHCRNLMLTPEAVCEIEELRAQSMSSPIITPSGAEDSLNSALHTLKCYRGEVAIDPKRPNDLREIETVIAKLESVIKKANGLVEIGEMRESGVT